MWIALLPDMQEESPLAAVPAEAAYLIAAWTETNLSAAVSPVEHSIRRIVPRDETIVVGTV